MTLPQMLEGGLQLPGDVQTMSSLGAVKSFGFFTPVAGVNRSPLIDPGDAKHLFSMYK